MTKPIVYLETTIVSYLSARKSKDVIIAAHQQITQEWWTQRREHYEVYVSQLVVHEISRGDQNAAQKRLEALQGIPSLEITEEAIALAEQFIRRNAIPRHAAEDALHVAIAATHGADYLLTWNCKHIANAEKWLAIANVCQTEEVEPPIICTPEELFGG